MKIASPSLSQLKGLWYIRGDSRFKKKEKSDTDVMPPFNKIKSERSV